MADITLEQALTAIQNLAKRKANAFVRRCGIAIDEGEDIASELMLTFITRWPRYDSKKAGVRTFASRVMDKELISILRYRLAQGRQPRDIPVLSVGPSLASVHQFRIDLERAMDPLPRPVRETASALSQLSAVDAADAAGCSRQMINRRKHCIREALIAGGINAGYFATGAARP